MKANKGVHLKGETLCQDTSVLPLTYRVPLRGRGTVLGPTPGSGQIEVKHTMLRQERRHQMWAATQHCLQVVARETAMTTPLDSLRNICGISKIATLYSSQQFSVRES